MNLKNESIFDTFIFLIRYGINLINHFDSNLKNSKTKKLKLDLINTVESIDLKIANKSFIAIKCIEIFGPINLYQEEMLNA